MRIKNWIALMSAVCLALIVLANTSGPAAWASQGNAPLGQGTVPTRTSTPSPAPPTVAPEPQATPVPAIAPTIAPTPAANSTPALLPVAGGDSTGGPVLAGLAGLGVLALAWSIRRYRAGSI
jgi:hypothetical protein